MRILTPPSQPHRICACVCASKLGKVFQAHHIQVPSSSPRHKMTDAGSDVPPQAAPEAPAMTPARLRQTALTELQRLGCCRPCTMRFVGMPAGDTNAYYAAAALAAAAAAAEAGPGRYCSQRHRVPLNSSNECSKCVSKTLRVTSAGPALRRLPPPPPPPRAPRAPPPLRPPLAPRAPHASGSSRWTPAHTHRHRAPRRAATIHPPPPQSPPLSTWRGCAPAGT